MGCCVSTSSQSSSSSRSNGETVSPSCFEISCGRRKKFSDHVNMLGHLSSISNRIFTNGKSRSSCIFTQQGHKGINQDAMIVWEDFINEDTTFCGVFDGHGPHGHLVAREVRDTLPLKLLSFIDSYEYKQNKQRTACCKDNNDSIEGKEESMWREAFLKSYKIMDKKLRSHPDLDCFCSGSTAITVVKQGSNLFMGYIGDSRAILASKDINDLMLATQLTVDLKPDLPNEAERIKRCRGRVFALQDEPEVQRVWLPFDDAPGLAMARAFGDFCLKDYGVISIPEFCHQTLTESDKFIVLASDGVWDVLSNEEVVEIISSAPARSSAARILVDSAAREWKSKYPTSKMDDCAVVCLYLDRKMDLESDYEEQNYSSATLQEENDAYKRVVAAAAAAIEVEGTSETVAQEDQNWSGLEAVTRVNSLVQLPRFSEERQRP
ncbi:PPM-type phosphatase domain-containing protein [Heracleum sosnowskyi]|uniref:protein-serine/threonine phosphatase n=1 Tax=Heracleum sosnowskyi TaxID=360622 RepID=A0AAD8IRR8_9APIA|nr:PPM-type phosphatase domain-containing protein [Heracleum sosnowskyi]